MRGRHRPSSTDGGMFKLPHHVALSDDYLNSLPDPGQEREWLERREAFRSSRGPEFPDSCFADENGEQNWELTCPMCGCEHAVEADSFDSYGGTTEGYTACGFCGYTRSWADLSAVI